MGKSIKKTVFVGISGGVDSSVSALLLKNKGYNVVGVFIKTWSPDFIECTWKKERLDAIRICTQLDIPYLECDAVLEYKEKVAKYMINEYKIGNTPNPDVMCNREVKFGIFKEFAKLNNADYIATGHYAINYYSKKDNTFYLKKSKDTEKDQTYFLWKLNQNDLEMTLFPIGDLKKNKVREIATLNNLITYDKKDSQGVCFLGMLNMKDFLKHYIKEKNGDIVDEEGNVIGTHDGVYFYTIGERHGFTIFNKANNNLPYYIIGKDIDNNILKVSNNIKTNRLLKNTYYSSNYNWINEKIDYNINYSSLIRYNGKLHNTKISRINNEKIKIKFTEKVLIDSGQSIVFYNNDTCIGGAIVE